MSTPVERFLEYLKVLLDEVKLYHAGLVTREVVRARMMPWAEKLVTVLFNEMDALAVPDRLFPSPRHLPRHWLRLRQI